MKIAQIVVCNDVARIPDGRYCLLGVYGPAITLIPGNRRYDLTVWFQIEYEPTDAGDKRILIQFASKADKLIKSWAIQPPPNTNKELAIFYGHRKIPLSVTEPGFYQIRVLFEGQSDQDALHWNLLFQKATSPTHPEE